MTPPVRPRCKGTCGDAECEEMERDWQATAPPVRWPKLTPTKPERLIVHCPRCYAQLLVRKHGVVEECKTCKGEAK